jgi:hypothetical protein
MRWRRRERRGGEEDKEGLFYHRDAENTEFRIFENSEG